MKSRAEKQRSVSVDQKHMQLIDLHTERVFMLQHAGFCSVVVTECMYI